MCKNPMWEIHMCEIHMCEIRMFEIHMCKIHMCKIPMIMRKNVIFRKWSSVEPSVESVQLHDKQHV